MLGAIKSFSMQDSGNDGKIFRPEQDNLSPIGAVIGVEQTVNLNCI
jgi:hypothetical protein